MYSYERLIQAISYEKRITPMGRFNVQNESDRGVSLSKRLNSCLNRGVALPRAGNKCVGGVANFEAYDSNNVRNHLDHCT